MAERKKVLFLNRAMPYGTARTQEALDLLLLASSFEQDLSVVFLDDAVFQLKKGQDPANILDKPFTRVLKALPLYEINQVYVEQESLLKRGLKPEDLMLTLKIMDAHHISQIINQQDIIFSL